ncbi:MAG: hypothetical protein Q8N26_37060 [Myxococcales bacterium]|nr:hypothetical protein [Myxococcales bacterium]
MRRLLAMSLFALSVGGCGVSEPPRQLTGQFRVDALDGTCKVCDPNVTCSPKCNCECLAGNGICYACPSNE